MTNLNNIGRRGILKGAALGAAAIASGSLLSRTASKVKGFHHLPSQSFGSQFPPVNLGG